MCTREDGYTPRLRYLSPEEFEAKWRVEQLKAVEEQRCTEHAQAVRFSNSRPEAVQN